MSATETLYRALGHCLGSAIEPEPPQTVQTRQIETVDEDLHALAQAGVPLR